MTLPTIICGILTLIFGVVFGAMWGLSQHAALLDWLQARTIRRWQSAMQSLGYACSLLFMPSLQVAMFVWGLTCALDNIGWLVVYHKNRDKFREIEK